MLGSCQRVRSAIRHERRQVALACSRHARLSATDQRCRRAWTNGVASIQGRGRRGWTRGSCRRARARPRSGVETAARRSAASAARQRRISARPRCSRDRSSFCKNLGVWEAVAADSEPITAIRIIDDTGALLQAPEVVFTAAELGLDAFGCQRSESRAGGRPSQAVAAAESNVALIRDRGGHGLEARWRRRRMLTTKDGETIEAALVVGADGRSSVCRPAAGIATRDLGLSAEPPCRIVRARAPAPAHLDGVPSPGRTVHDRAAAGLGFEPGLGRDAGARPSASPASTTTAFAAALEKRLQGLLGSIGEIGPRAVFRSRAHGRGVRRATRRAGRRSRPCHPAHRRPGPEPRPAGRRRARRLRGRRPARGTRPGRRRRSTPTTRARRTDVASRIIDRRCPQPLADLGLRCRSTSRAASACMRCSASGPLRRCVVREG